MSDIDIRIVGKAGRITLTRPKALNAVTWEMIRAIDAALVTWAEDDAVALVIIDAAGDRAFAAGGDIVDLYNTGKAGDFGFGRRFWAEEYRLNARIAEYPKPFVAFMHGFVMGGGVGISCHGSHRIVDESVQIAMPECGIGLIPDVGGSWLLARAGAGIGAYYGLTGARMGPAEAIGAGFADSFVPKDRWAGLIGQLEETGDAGLIAGSAVPAPVAADTETLSHWFAGDSAAQILAALDADGSEEAAQQKKALGRQSPLSVVCGLAAIRAAAGMTLRQALAQEYRYVWRCMEHGDFLEGIRAQVIDKDRTPSWRHVGPGAVSEADIAAMLAPLGDNELTF